MTSQKTSQQQQQQQQNPSYLYIKSISDGKRYKFVSKTDIRTLTGQRIDQFLQVGAGIAPRTYVVLFEGERLRPNVVLSELGVEVGSTLEMFPKPLGEDSDDENNNNNKKENNSSAVPSAAGSVKPSSAPSSHHQQQQQQKNLSSTPVQSPSSSSSSSSSGTPTTTTTSWIIIKNISDNKKYKFVSRSDVKELTGLRVKQFLNVAAGIPEIEQLLRFQGSKIEDRQILGDLGVELGNTIFVEIVDPVEQERIQKQQEEDNQALLLQKEINQHLSTGGQTPQRGGGGMNAGISSPSPSAATSAAASPWSSVSSQLSPGQEHKTVLFIKNRSTGKAYKFVSTQYFNTLVVSKVKHFIMVAAGVPILDQLLRFNMQVLEDDDTLESNGIHNGDTLFLEVDKLVHSHFIYTTGEKRRMLGANSHTLLLEQMEPVIKASKQDLFDQSCKELEAKIVKYYIPLKNDASDPLLKFKQSISATAALETTQNLPSDAEFEDEDDDGENEESRERKLALYDSDDDGETPANVTGFIDNSNNNNSNNENNNNNPNNTKPLHEQQLDYLSSVGSGSGRGNSASAVTTTSSSSSSSGGGFNIVGTESVYMVLDHAPSSSSSSVGGAGEDGTTAATLLSPKERREILRRLRQKQDRQRKLFCKLETQRRMEIANEHYVIATARLYSEFEDDVRGEIQEQEDKIFHRRIISEEAIVGSRIHTQNRVQRRVDAKKRLDVTVSEAEIELKELYEKELEETRNADFAVRFRKACNRAHEVLKNETHLLFESGKNNALVYFGLEAGSAGVVGSGVGGGNNNRGGDDESSSEMGSSSAATSPDSSRAVSAVGTSRSAAAAAAAAAAGGGVGGGFDSRPSTSEDASVARSERQAVGLSHHFSSVAQFLQD